MKKSERSDTSGTYTEQDGEDQVVEDEGQEEQQEENLDEQEEEQAGKAKPESFFPASMILFQEKFLEGELSAKEESFQGNFKKYSDRNRENLNFFTQKKVGGRKSKPLDLFIVDIKDTRK